ncbi:MAG: MaoC family dehydratase N-terminal domain-containing protein [Actinomycetota bacterium]|nr:MaoC family dehydratase N-terminal domain-containing protein [Actinomycetota bacterium]
MDPADLVDRTFGPSPLRVCVENVSDFVRATGDNPVRWTDAAPPGFMAAAMFAVASDLLRQLAERSVIHGEQTFKWHRPLQMESELEVQGTVTRVRERGGVDFVNFEVEVSDQIGAVAEASSLFLVSGDFAPGKDAEERQEPAPEYDGNPGAGQKSASRADLVRYAAATRDWNPIHWDHEAAVSAGLPGVVAHGLLQAAWALAAGSKLRSGNAPLRAARVRFRNPLLPAVPVVVSVDETAGVANVAIADGDVEYLSARIELTEQ